MSGSRAKQRAVAAYVANVALLATHQADAAFQREWDVFGVPGGIVFFLAFNAAAVTGLLLGLVAVATNHRLARVAAFACGTTGLVTGAIHAVFLRLVPSAFSTMASLLVLGAIQVASVAQLVMAVRPGR